jgi:DNA-binding response OmpR family regulator
LGVVTCILIAEDEALIALSLAEILEAEGFEVRLAFDGAAALLAARNMGSTLDVLDGPQHAGTVG